MKSCFYSNSSSVANSAIYYVITGHMARTKRESIRYP
ncbi:hypothetical protein TNCV_3668261, partial [Trichonephila clavipes]